MNVSQYLQKAKTLADELTASSPPLSNAEFNIIIYRNLGLDFQSLIIALNQCLTQISF